MDRTLSRRLSVGLLAPLLAGVLAAPAAADWLVTREGARVETRGPWQEKGKLVVFTRPDGTLASLRADLVDLDASRKATAEAKVQATQPAAPKPKRPSVRSLTDKDFHKPAPAPGEAPADKEGAAAGETPAAAPGEGAAPGENTGAGAEASNPLEVVSWERQEGAGQGVRLTGMLRNNSADQAAGITLEAGLYDENGALLARQEAQLDSAALGPGESTPFTIEVPGVFAFASVKFQMRSASFKLRAAPPDAGPSS